MKYWGFQTENLFREKYPLKVLKRPNILFDRIDTSPEDSGDNLLCWWMNDLERLDKEENIKKYGALARKQRKENVPCPILWRLLSPVLCQLFPLFMPLALSKIARFLSFSVLPPVNHNAPLCTVLDKCNLCDNILSNDTNLKKHRMKYHKGDPFKQCLLCPRLCHVMSFVCQETNPHCSFPAMQCRNVKIFPCRALHCNWMDDAMN